MKPGSGLSVDPASMVFVVGLHRSGTTLLARMLQDHPEVAGLADTGVPMDEGQFLQDVYPPANRYGGPGRFGFDARSHLDESSPLVSGKSAERILEQWAPYWDGEGRYYMEKSPPHIVRTRFLQALFPGSRFVILLRHPLAVSYATRKWSRTMVPSLIRHWLVCHERFERDRPRLSHSLMLRYEDLVSQPDQVMGRVWDFLQLERAPTNQQVKSDVNRRYLETWERACRLPLVGRWYRRKAMELEPRVSRFGYSLYPPYRI